MANDFSSKYISKSPNYRVISVYLSVVHISDTQLNYLHVHQV